MKFENKETVTVISFSYKITIICGGFLPINTTFFLVTNEQALLFYDYYRIQRKTIHIVSLYLRMYYKSYPD